MFNLGQFYLAVFLNDSELFNVDYINATINRDDYLYTKTLFKLVFYLLTFMRFVKLDEFTGNIPANYTQRMSTIKLNF